MNQNHASESGFKAATVGWWLVIAGCCLLVLAILLPTDERVGGEE